jgi:hypothetical protein
MRKFVHILIVAAAAAILLSASRSVRAAGPREPGAAPGSKTRQLMLRQALDKEVSGTLVAELNRSKKLWKAMGPERLRQLRERYYAFLRLDDQQQAALIDAAPEFDKLSESQKKLYRERAAWLKEVVRSLTPAERDELKKMTPTERARRLLELKARLATSRPTTAPAK